MGYKENSSNTDDRKVKFEGLIKRVVSEINTADAYEIKFQYARKFTGNEIVQLVARIKSECKCVNGCLIDAEYITFIKGE